MAADIPYLKLFRAGVYQPRWEPGPKLRDAGLKGRALRDDAGQWLPPDAARTEAERLNTEAERTIQSGARPKRGPRRHPRCFDALWDAYTRSPRWQKKAEATQRDYTAKARHVLEVFGDAPVAAITRGDLLTWWEKLYAERGHAMANGTLAVLRLLMTYAVDKEWRRDNPALKLGIESLDPRVVVWMPDECKAFVATADAMGLNGVADAFVLALHTSQRLSDVLALVEQRTENGRARFLQSKTKVRVTVPVTDQLGERLAEMRRRRATTATDGVVELVASGPLVRRPDGSEYDRFSFNKDFRAVRDAIADAHDDVGTKEFRDLRDTAITRLADAGCDIYEIAAITGHAINTIHTVLRHYVSISEQMAVRGIDRLKLYLADQGIAV